ncbi:coenzyme F420-0:L-glutamate ligase [Bradyrhizobium canariense]|uniref:Coenzyme F420-0 gamma-glutamyl ligase n=1 Tax=Bradyrhizobium canariense TaxID=255045 RepID=A0A1H2B741_9BRAD|nr:coenzyme F420-0:L-glutamate ligase [Bradyrhizobium canariense]SDT53872.1 coenzyme F420-0 gamma-glutamyl ligase [Bradyrhizobium canariense]
MISHDLWLRPLPDVPLIEPGDDLAEIILASIEKADWDLQNGDVLVMAQKIVSKAENRTVDLATVIPSPRAIELATEVQKDARLVELILSESETVVRRGPGVLIVEHKLGFVMANAGIDRSNVNGEDHALLLPVDPDRSATAIRRAIAARVEIDVGVLIIDSFGRAWRNGTIGTAIGASGVPTLLDLRGRPDLFGRPLETTEVGWADELAAAASLMMGQAGEGRPVILVRGLVETGEGSTADLLRPKQKDLFR